MQLTLWGPADQHAQFEVGDESEIVPTLLEWCRKIGIRPSDVDYQIDDGLRILGDPSAQAAGIDVCGLPRERDP